MPKIKVLYAVEAMILVSAKSTPPLTNPPTTGTILPRFIIPFVPNLVTNLKPTFWFMEVRTFPGVFFYSRHCRFVCESYARFFEYISG